ncbi:MAG: DHH family phosphoesterase [Nanoarchaeota archaeon]
MGNFSELESILQQYSREMKVGVLMHDNPDPDSMAGGVFFKELLKGMGYTCPTVLFGGEVDQQNKHLFTELGVNDNSRKNRPFKNIYHFNYDINFRNLPQLNPDFYDKFVFVDHNGNNSRWVREGKVAPEKILAVIDHHDCSKMPYADFIDCRNVGAASTILAEYLKDGATQYFEKNSLETLYSLLYMGLQIDTNYLREGATQKDLEMLKTYAPNVNYQLVSSFFKFKRKSDWMDAYGRAYYTREPAYNNANVASVGKIRSKRTRGAIPVAADDLLKEDKINTIYLFGFDGKYVDVAIRTEKDGMDYHSILEMFPGAVGGGRDGAGRIQIPTCYFFNGNGYDNNGNNGSMDKYMKCVDDAERIIKDKIKERLSSVFEKAS